MQNNWTWFSEGVGISRGFQHPCTHYNEDFLLVLEGNGRKAWLCLGLVDGFSDLSRSTSIRFSLIILQIILPPSSIVYRLFNFSSVPGVLYPLCLWAHPLPLLLLVDSFLVCFLQICTLFHWFSDHTHVPFSHIIGAACGGYCQGPLSSSSWSCCLRVLLQIKYRSLFVFFDAVVWMILLC